MKTPTLEYLIKKGKYDWVNSDITTEHFPDEGLYQPDKVELLHFDKLLSSEEIQKLIEEKGYRPATIRELLAYGATNPDKQKEFPIVALGSVWRNLGGRSVAFLYCGGGGRRLSLLWLENRWDARCRFAVVRKSLKPGNLSPAAPEPFDPLKISITYDGVEYKVVKK